MSMHMHAYAYASQVSMLEAAKLMAEGRLNRLLVTSAEGSADLIGIISSTDLVFALLTEQDPAPLAASMVTGGGGVGL